MVAYRVNVAAEDALAVDEALCAKQWMRQRLFFHALMVAISVGLWAPGFAVWLVLALGGRGKRFTSGYAVRVDGGQLYAGNGEESRSIPLDAIVGVSVSSGVVTVATGPGQQPLQLFGLQHPTLAAKAILEARDAHVHREVRRERVDVAPRALRAADGMAEGMAEGADEGAVDTARIGRR